MIQTDPIINEKEIPEPVMLQTPRDYYYNEQKHFEFDQLPQPMNEAIAIIALPMPQDPDIKDTDWAESALYRYVRIEQTKLLNKKGVPSDFRPSTPQSQRGMSQVKKMNYNIK